MRLRTTHPWITAIALFAALALGTAHAEFPDRSLRIVVPFTPGGGTDIITRQLARNLEQDLGQTVIVENRPGGSAIIGTDAVARSAPDGYTLLMASFSHAVNPSMQKQLPYDTQNAFAPVAMIGKSPNVLVVATHSPFQTVRELMAAARAQPGKLTFGSYGSGTSAGLFGELFKIQGNFDILHVPYKGSAPAITDLIGGQIDMIFSTSASVRARINTGQLRALAVTTAQRSPLYPDVPTIAESGLPEYAADSWYGLFAPAGTPRDIVARLNQSVRNVIQQADLRRALELEGIVPDVGTPEALGAHVRAEERRWRGIVEAAGLAPNS